MKNYSSPGIFIAGVTLLLPLLLNFASSADPLELGDTCVVSKACGDKGLHCETCIANRNLLPRCTRIAPVDPKTKAGTGLPFNRYSWLTTHNSFSILNSETMTGVPIVTAFNQQDSITEQLNNGVRGLMLDLYDFRDDIWLCHSFNGKCLNFTAFQPATNGLKEIQTFLETNPKEVITIFIEDYVTSTKGLSKIFASSGLKKYWFPVSRMPKNGGDWPLLSDMIAKNQRLVVFTSKSTKENSEGIAYEWRYIVENQYGDGGMKAGLCPDRAESASMNTTSRSLVLMNYFGTIPDFFNACKYNSRQLMKMLDTCHGLSGGRWANFIAVDFYKRSDGGGAPLATDVANGHLVCGCDNIASCKETNGTFGSCVSPKAIDISTKKVSLASECRIESPLIRLGFMLLAFLFL